MPPEEKVPNDFPVPRGLVVGLLLAALLCSGWALTRGWHNSLRDAHEFRQLQTALTTFYFKKEGLKLAYETPVLGPPWSIPMEFPVYQAVVAKLSQAANLPLEESGRMVSIFFFYATLPAVWLLLRRRMPGPLDPLPAVAAMLLCPLYLFYSRVFMIESTALCFTAWFVVFLDRTLDRPLGWALPAAWVFGMLGALTKVTTFAAFWVACALLVLERIAARRRTGEPLARAAGRSLGVAVLAAALPLLAGVAWVVFSDHLKELNPFGSYLTSGSLRQFNLGTLAQRLSFEWWRSLGYITSHSVIALPGLAVLAVGLWASPPSYRRLALACLLCYPAGALLFANLYYVHDYYSYATTLFPAAALGIVSTGLLRSARVSRLAAGVLVIAALAGQVAAFRTSYYYFYDRENPPVPPEAAIIRAVTPPEEVFAGFGLDWNSLLPYYAERRAIMPFDSHVNDFAALDRSLAALGSRHVTTMLVARRHRDDHNFTDILIGKLGMCAKPIARTETMDIYVHRDRAAAAVQALGAKKDWSAELNLKPDDNFMVLKEIQDLAARPWLETLASFSPRPFQAKGMYPVNYLDDDDNPENLAKRRLLTQVPTEIHFRPPPGARTVSAATGMLPSAYTPPNNTPGMLVSVFEELPDGTRRRLFERLLMPLTEPKDRGDIAIDYAQEQQFTGVIVFAHYTVPSGSIAFGWGYWRHITIR